tara:strand:- start:16 stop:501 length:486 start_codon:yes stop_codon:yes gene_type:complete
MEKYVVYLNRFNEVKPYKIKIIFVIGDIVDVKDLVENKNKTFKRSNILSNHKNFNDAQKEAEKLQKNYKLIPRQKTDRSNPEKKLEVCFTGFSKKDKENLIEIAKINNFFVRTEVTKKLSLLVCGDNAGPSKLIKASKMNVPKVYGKDGFKEFLDTGEYIV